jgi:hypothetical protein
MADVTTIREGLATRLATITGLRSFAYIPDAVAVPCAIVGLPGIDYLQAMRSNIVRGEFPVRVLVSRASDRAGQGALLDYMDPTGTKSVKAALDADNTLGGAASFAVLTSCKPPGVYTIGGVDYLGVEFLIDVMG